MRFDTRTSYRRRRKKCEKFENFYKILWYFKLISGCFWHVLARLLMFFFCLKLYGLPGGEQVDGLPPAASRKKHTFMLLLSKVIRGWGSRNPRRLQTYWLRGSRYKQMGLGADFICAQKRVNSLPGRFKSVLRAVLLLAAGGRPSTCSSPGRP